MNGKILQTFQNVEVTLKVYQRRLLIGKCIHTHQQSILVPIK